MLSNNLVQLLLNCLVPRKCLIGYQNVIFEFLGGYLHLHHHMRDAQHAEDNDQGVHGCLFATDRTYSRGPSCHLHSSPGEEEEGTIKCCPKKMFAQHFERSVPSSVELNDVVVFLVVMFFVDVFFVVIIFWYGICCLYLCCPCLYCYLCCPCQN